MNRYLFYIADLFLHSELPHTTFVVSDIKKDQRMTPYPETGMESARLKYPAEMYSYPKKAT